MQRDWRDGEEIDVSGEMMALTLRIVGKTLFDADVQSESQVIGEAVTQALHFITARNFNLLAPPLNWPTPGNRRFAQAMRRLDDTIYPIIQERRASGEDKGDLLSMLLHAQDEDDGTGMSDVQLRDEVMTIFLAGHETTANRFIGLCMPRPALQSRACTCRPRFATEHLDVLLTCLVQPDTSETSEVFSDVIATMPAVAVGTEHSSAR